MRTQPLWLLLCVCCGHAEVLPPAFPTPQPEPPREVLQQASSPPRRESPAVVVGVPQHGELFAHDLEKGLLWRTPVQARSAPRAAGNLVILEEESGPVARDLSSGEERYRLDEGKLIGADGSDDRVIAVYQLDGDHSPMGLVVASQAGEVVWELLIESPTGPPALSGDSVVVPWGTHRVSILRTRDGAERARLSLKRSVAGHAFVDRGSVYVGQHGLMRLQPTLGSDSLEQDANNYSPVARPMPGQPGLLPSSYEPVGPLEHAVHRVRLDWRIRPGKTGLGMEDDALYLQFYRYVFALEAESDAVRWVYQGAQDVVATAVQPGGVFIANAAGELLFLNELGHTLWHGSLGLNPVVAHIRPGNFIPNAQDARAATSHRPRPLAEQLSDAAKLDDARLASARVFALEHLARFEEATVTGTLVDLCDDGNAPQPVRRAACAQLAQRTEGKRHVLERLRRQGGADSPPPPVGALASAAEQMNLRAAAPHLVAHLRSPHTPARELAPLLRALAKVGRKRDAQDVERFLEQHHAEVHEEHLAHGLHAAIEALAQLRGKAARPVLERIATDGMSMKGLGELAAKTLSELNRPRHRKSKTSAQTRKPKTAAPAPKKPKYLSMALVQQTLGSSERKLRKCLRMQDALSSARVSMVVGAEGEIERVYVTPTTLQSCVEPLIRAHRFAITEAGRQQVVHVIRSRTFARSQSRGTARARGRRNRLSGSKPD